MSTTARIPTCPTRSVADPASERTLRTLVLGLGNPLRTDDSVGLRVVDRLRSALDGWPGLELAEDYWGGLRLMERLVGYDRAIIIDAQRSGAPAGTVSTLPANAPPTRHGNSVHDMDLWTALEFGRQAGAAVPMASGIRIVAIEAADVDTFGEECTPAVAAGIPRAAEAVQALLIEWR